MSYNYENRLTQLQYPGQTVLGTYAYDGAGHRVQRVEGGTTTNFAYDGDRVVLEMNSQLQTQARYTIEGDSYYSPLISMKRGGSSYWYLYNGLGSTRKIIDSNQSVTDSYSYEAFGEITSSSGSTTNPYRYVGALGYAYSPVVTSLVHVGARYYAPGLGRFMSQDSARESRNLYAYVGGNAVNDADPAGLWEWRPWKWRVRPRLPWWAYVGAAGATVPALFGYAKMVYEACRKMPEGKEYGDRCRVCKGHGDEVYESSARDLAFWDPKLGLVWCRVKDDDRIYTYNPQIGKWVLCV